MSAFPKLISLRPQPGCRLWLRYDDGSEGSVDLSDLRGQGVFTSWEIPGRFETACLTSYNAVAWDETVELDADSLYLRLSGKRAEDVLPATAFPAAVLAGR